MAVPGHMFASANTRKGRKPPEFESFFFKGPRAQEKEKESRLEEFVNFLDSKANGN